MYISNRLQEQRCKKCGRTIRPVKLLKTEKKTKKKWYIIQCPICDYEFDIEEYESTT